MDDLLSCQAVWEKDIRRLHETEKVGAFRQEEVDANQGNAGAHAGKLPYRADLSICPDHTDPGRYVVFTSSRDNRDGADGCRHRDRRHHRRRLLCGDGLR